MRRTRPWLMLAVALASGGVAALLAMRYLRQQATPMLAAHKTGDIVIAARPLPLGTVLADADVKTIEWSGAALPVGYATSKADVLGRGVMSPLQENEPILDGKLAPKGAGGGLPLVCSAMMALAWLAIRPASGMAAYSLSRGCEPMKFTEPTCSKKARTAIGIGPTSASSRSRRASSSASGTTIT